MDVEVLASGEPADSETPSRTRKGGWVGALRLKLRRHHRFVVVLVAVAIAAFGLDRWVQQAQLDTLLAEIGSAEAAAALTDGRLAEGDRWQPVIVDSIRVYGLPDRPGGDVTAAAREGAAQTAAVAARVASLRIMPWHRSLERTRQDYLEQLNARVAALAVLAERPEVSAIP